MKTQLSVLAFSALIFTMGASFVPVSSTALQTTTKVEQAQNGLSFFRAHRQGKEGVATTWGVNSSSGISGFTLEKTYEDPNDPYSVWEVVSNTPCNGARTYKHVDGNVTPGFLNYRLVVAMSDGSELISNIATVHIVSR